METKKGSLIVVGSGIKSVGHFTLETQAWIRESDVVVYCVADPVTEIWIKKNSKKCEDLYALYGNEKKRINTYTEMVERTLFYVRQGLDTCAVYYGHPGVFVNPSHRAIKIAREEGYSAAMLPGITALDCLYSDLGVDPSKQGSQTFEATDLLLRQRHINIDCHVILWQVGCVGDLKFNFGGYDARNFHILVDYLEKYYDPNHKVTHYQGSQYPVCKPQIETMPLKDLRNIKPTGISTLYIPPQIEKATDVEMLYQLGLRKRESETADKNNQPQQLSCERESTPPKAEYMPVPDESELADFIMEMAQNPALLSEFNRNPETTINMYASLTPEERRILLSSHPGAIRMTIKKHKDFPHLDLIYQVHNSQEGAGTTS